MRFLCAFLIAFPLTCRAAVVGDTLQRIERIVDNVDKLLDVRDKYRKTKADTNFIVRSPERLRLKAVVNGSGSVVTAEGYADGDKFKSVLEANNKYTLSLNASYRGISLGASVNPAKFAGKNKDYEFNLNAYSNRMGADVVFQSANTYHGTIDNSRGSFDVPTGMVRQNMLYANAYYVFNSRRFSYPAAFTQSWLQKRSSGSVMLGVSFLGGNFRLSRNETLGNNATRLSMAYFGIGGGYAYNWVLKNRWLIHLSTLPQLVVASSCHQTVNGQREEAPYRFPNIIAVGRIAVVKHFDRYFAGFNTVVNTSSTGDHDELHLNTVKWRARVFFGVKIF